MPRHQPSGNQQDVEGALHIDGKAGGAALVGFEAMAQPTVRVAIGPDCINHSGSVCGVEQHLSEAVFGEARLTIEEGPTGSENAVRLDFFGDLRQSPIS